MSRGKCSVLNCGRLHYGRGLCNAHYQRKYRGRSGTGAVIVMHGQSGTEAQGRRDRSGAYSSWYHMKERCYNTKNRKYSLYGGRGITVCDEWRNSFIKFFADMGERPVGMTLDRVNVNGNYEAGNCRWATVKEQNANRRCVIEKKEKGQKMTKNKENSGIDGLNEEIKALEADIRVRTAKLRKLKAAKAILVPKKAKKASAAAAVTVSAGVDA